MSLARRAASYAGSILSGAAKGGLVGLVAAPGLNQALGGKDPDTEIGARFAVGAGSVLGALHGLNSAVDRHIAESRKTKTLAKEAAVFAERRRG